MELEYQQHQILEQLNGFHDSVSLLATCQESFQSNLTDIQAFLANISLVQSHLMEKIRASRQPSPVPTTIPQIPISSLHIPLSSTSTLLPHPSQPSSVGPPPTWGSPYFRSFSLPYTNPVIDYPPASHFYLTATTTLRTHLPSSSFHPPYPPSFFTRAPPPSPGPKHMKTKLPRFSEDNPYNWLALAEEYLDYHRVAAVDRVIIARLHFLGDAALWFKWYKVHFGSGLWSTFTESLLQQLRPDDLLDFNISFSHVS